MRLKLEKSARARRRAASRTWPTLRNPAACPSSRAGHCRGRSLPPPGAEVGSLIPLPDQGPDRSGFPPARRRAQARVGGPGRAGASDLSPKEMADGLRRRTAAGDRRSETRRGRSNDYVAESAAERVGSPASRDENGQSNMLTADGLGARCSQPRASAILKNAAEGAK